VIWWINQPNRALAEKAEVTLLAERVSWLRILKWDLSDIPSLKLDFEIEVGRRQFSLTLVYPHLFPEFPACIIPKEPERLSSHQYGAKGELCLQWRADNWRPDITGSMLIESAYRLLSNEEGGDKEVESAHDLTMGQEVRSRIVRFLLSEDCKRALLNLLESSQTPLKTSERYFGKTIVTEITQLGEDQSPLWKADPVTKFENFTRLGFAFRRPAPNEFESKANVKELLGDKLDEWTVTHPGKSLTMVFVNDNQPEMFELLANKDAQVIKYTTIAFQSDVARLPGDYGALRAKCVGIVGCGSVGSKIAGSLARAGVCKFVLVDSDLFLPGNEVRNELDLRAAGVNKTKAVEQRILEINGKANVDVSEILLGRQESGSLSASSVNMLSKCDLIIDATAEISAFMTCAAVAQAYKKPLVWGRVYEGGIGGLIARVRPDIEPPPQIARRQIDGWFQQKGIPWVSSEETRAYAMNDGGGTLVATDAEVGLVAMHMVCLAVDALISNDSAKFPQPVYVVGFTKKWIFSQPFDVWPIELVPEGAWGAATEENKDTKLKELVEEFFPEADGKSAS
jgi:sulfur-carrier protein adenylyltransferase/sulfurtransferase